MSQASPPKNPYGAIGEPVPGKPKLGRQCFVTVGATAGFRQLLAETLREDFLKFLSNNGYDIMDVQCGPDYVWYRSLMFITETFGVKIRCFRYTKNMQDHMLECRGDPGIRLPGCIVTHAGSGTILEALRYECPLVVVPNPTLMDNHQAELAEECEKQNWAIYGKLGHLTEAIRRSHDRLAESQHNRNGSQDEHIPAPYSPPPFPVPESERITMFDWMVLTCYPDELVKQQHLLTLSDAEADHNRSVRAGQQRELDASREDREQKVRDRRARLQID